MDLPMTRTSKSQRAGRATQRVDAERSATTPALPFPARDRITTWKARSDLALKSASRASVNLHRGSVARAATNAKPRNADGLPR